MTCADAGGVRVRNTTRGHLQQQQQGAVEGCVPAGADSVLCTLLPESEMGDRGCTGELGTVRLPPSKIFRRPKAATRAGRLLRRPRSLCVHTQAKHKQRSVMSHYIFARFAAACSRPPSHLPTSSRACCSLRMAATAHAMGFSSEPPAAKNCLAVREMAPIARPPLALALLAALGFAGLLLLALAEPLLLPPAAPLPLLLAEPPPLPPAEPPLFALPVALLLVTLPLALAGPPPPAPVLPPGTHGVSSETCA